jgi:cellulose synthase/poly-beta-1,6-N-acetylglucosamine synthase-like glycosyltransferase
LSSISFYYAVIICFWFARGFYQLFSDLTVGICAYNEESNIRKLLNNILFDQDLSPKSEILVICSGCTDRTVEIVQHCHKKDSRIKTVVEKNREGKASAVNKILSNAKNDIILFISADTLPNKNCFFSLTRPFKDSKIGMVCGKPIPNNKENSLVGKIVNLLWRFHDEVFDEMNKSDQLRHASEIFCIRKGIVNKIPQETVNDDAYIALTTIKKGWKIDYEPEGYVTICGPQTISDYFRQRRRILWGHYQVKKLTGESPQYLVHMIFLKPTKVLKLFLKLITEKGFFTISAFLFLEFILNYLAIIDTILGKTHAIWNIAKSTKEL